MANGSGYVTHSKKGIGDVAVDGLLAGMAAGVGMGVLLMALGLIEGVGPFELLGRFDPAGAKSAAVGGLLHLAVSGIYGVLFAIVYSVIRGRRPAANRYGALIGATYGLMLWLAAQYVFLPELNSPLGEMSPLSFAAGHLAYGWILGQLLARQRRDG